MKLEIEEIKKIFNNFEVPGFKFYKVMGAYCIRYAGGSMNLEMFFKGTQDKQVALLWEYERYPLLLQRTIEAINNKNIDNDFLIDQGKFFIDVYSTEGNPDNELRVNYVKSEEDYAKEQAIKFVLGRI